MPSASWANGWLAGDIVTAAEFRKGIGSIADSTLGADAASVTFSSIPQTYAHLLLVCRLRSAAAANTDTMAIRFNADATASYDYQYQRAIAVTTSSAEVFAGTSCYIGDCPAASVSSVFFANSWIFIPSYRDGNNLNLFAINAQKFGTTTGQLMVQQIAGAWRNNGPVTSLTVLSGSAANLRLGSRFTLYALGA